MGGSGGGRGTMNNKTISNALEGGTKGKGKSRAGLGGSRDIEGTAEQRLEGDKGVRHVDNKIKCKPGGPWFSPPSPVESTGTSS